jgi:hypothetical protein
MRKVLQSLGLALGLFLLVPPVYAVNFNYTGEASLNWNTLRFSGIPITLTEKNQGHGAFAPPNHSQNTIFQDWISHGTSFSFPQGETTAIANTNADSNRLYAFVNLSGVGEPARFGGGQANSASVERSSYFTAMDTGQLTVSIDYTLRQVGSLPTGFEATERGLLVLAAGNFSRSGIDQSLLMTTLGAHAQSGTLSITESYQRGETGQFFAEPSVVAGFVPLPDMLWPTVIGMIGLAFYVERTRRKPAS